MAGIQSVKKTQVEGCLVIVTDVFEDLRGSFFEAWNRMDFIRASLPTHWPQDNISVSYKNVMRGLHIQRRNPQGKLVRCLQGEIVDVCLDLRPHSSTFKKIHCEHLCAGKALYLPPGTAHGFLALDARNVVYYKCTALYDGETDGGVDMADPEIGFCMPEAKARRLIRSQKDLNLPSLQQWLKDPRGLINVRRGQDLLPDNVQARGRR